MDIKAIMKLIEERQQELYDLLCELVRINSENDGVYGREKECAEYLAQVCQEIGLETDLYSPLDIEGFENHPDYLPGKHLENRYNMTARWRGTSDRDALMLMGHSDTVVIGDPELWSFEPLVGKMWDGKIWGRGACDDKYALATAVFLMKLLKEQGYVPRENILFTAYCDEERGGSHGALATVLRYPCDRIVNMDCKNFEIWHCASGGGEVDYCYHTKDPVDSAERTARAIPIIMEVIGKFAARRRTELENNRFYKDTIIPDTSLRYMGFRAGNRGADLGVGEVRFLMYTDKSREEILEEFSAMEAELKERLAPLGIESDGFIPATRFFHYGYAEPDCASIKDMQMAALEATGRKLNVCGSCLTDLSVILKYGSKEAYGFGIGRDFSAYGGAHQPDEFIECKNLLEYAKIMAAYILKVC